MFLINSVLLPHGMNIFMLLLATFQKPFFDTHGHTNASPTGPTRCSTQTKCCSQSKPFKLMPVKRNYSLINALRFIVCCFHYWQKAPESLIAFKVFQTRLYYKWVAGPGRLAQRKSVRFAYQPINPSSNPTETGIFRAR